MHGCIRAWVHYVHIFYNTPPHGAFQRSYIIAVVCWKIRGFVVRFLISTYIMLFLQIRNLTLLFPNLEVHRDAGGDPVTRLTSHPQGVVILVVTSCWVPCDWTSIPSRGSSNIPSCFIRVLSRIFSSCCCAIVTCNICRNFILLYLYLVNKLILKRSYNHYTYYTVTALVTGVTGYALK